MTLVASSLAYPDARSPPLGGYGQGEIDMRNALSKNHQIDRPAATRAFDSCRYTSLIVCTQQSRLTGDKPLRTHFLIAVLVVFANLISKSFL